MTLPSMMMMLTSVPRRLSNTYVFIVKSDDRDFALCLCFCSVWF